MPFLSKQFLKFFLSSGLAALVNFLSRIAFSFFVNFYLAVSLAYVLGILTAFSLNKLFVFKGGTARTSQQFIIFCIINGIAFIEILVISYLMKEILLPYFGIIAFSEELAHAVSLGSVAFTSFIGHKYFSFKGSL
ncbi:MAG: GtrA family protein [Candidatus Gracilibacteria bacterium]|nr:GtrA family protein [Candidatus Gracilibacteria bacterium]